MMFNRVQDKVYQNKYIKYLDQIGIETDPIINNIRTSVEENSYILDKIFSNTSYKMLSPNIFLENIIFKEVNKHLNEHYKDSVIFEDYMQIDTKSIIATQNSIIERPKIKRPSEIEEGFKEHYKLNNGFVRIARFENEMIKDNGIGRKGQAFVFEGIIPFKEEIHPFSQDEYSRSIWNNSFYDHEPRNIIGFCKTFNSLETDSLLWLNSYFLNIFDLKLDNYNNGLRAINEENEIILEFRQWRDNLIDNGASYTGQDSNISSLEGCDLLLREDYFNRIKELFPELAFYTKKL